MKKRREITTAKRRKRDETEVEDNEGQVNQGRGAIQRKRPGKEIKKKSREN